MTRPTTCPEGHPLTIHGCIPPAVHGGMMYDGTNFRECREGHRVLDSTFRYGRTANDPSEIVHDFNEETSA